MSGVNGCRRAVAAVALSFALAACSGGGKESSGTDAGASVTITHDTGTLDGGPDGSGTVAGSSTVRPVSSTEAPSSNDSASPATSATTVADENPPPDADPVSTLADIFTSDESDDLPGPPADDCVDVDPGAASVLMSFDDDRVLYAGAEAPSCLRVHAAQQLVVRNDGSVSANVQVGATGSRIAPTATTVTAPLGTLYDVGDVFDVYIESLDVSLVVQVLP